MFFIDIADSNCAFLCSLRVISLYLISQLIEQSILTLITRDTFVPNRCKFFLATKSILLFFDAKFFSAYSWLYT